MNQRRKLLAAAGVLSCTLIFSGCREFPPSGQADIKAGKATAEVAGQADWIPLFNDYAIETLYQPVEAVPDNYGAELIRNGNFEQFNDGTADGFKDDSSWAPLKAQYSKVTEAFEGTGAQRIVCGEFEGGRLQLEQNGIPVAEGKAYAVSFAARGNVDLRMIIAKKKAPYTFYSMNIFPLGNEWRQYSYTVVCRYTDPDARFMIGIVGNGEAVIDSLSMKQIHTDVPPGLYYKFTPPAEPIHGMLFGLHMHGASKHHPYPPVTPWPFVQFKVWRLWDCGVAWCHLEPEKGKWDFTIFDDYCALAKAHGVELVVPLALTPTWASSKPEQPSAYNKKGEQGKPGLGWAAPPKNMEDFRNYVRVVALRAKGVAHYYELWNEPNMSTFFSGTQDELVALHREASAILKQIDPANKLISSAVVGDHVYLDGLLDRGLAQYCDIIGFHFYNWGYASYHDAAKDLLVKIYEVKDVLRKHHVNKPLWNTEAGWVIRADKVEDYSSESTNKRVYSGIEASALIAQMYLYNWAAGIANYNYYTWDNATMGLVNKKNNFLPKKCAFAYNEIRDWMVGNTMLSCTQDKDGTWTAVLKKADGALHYIVWNNMRNGYISLADKKVIYAKSLFGEVKEIPNPGEIPVNPLPMLCSPDPLSPTDYSKYTLPSLPQK